MKKGPDKESISYLLLTIHLTAWFLCEVYIIDVHNMEVIVYQFTITTPHQKCIKR